MYIKQTDPDGSRARTCVLFVCFVLSIFLAGGECWLWGLCVCVLIKTQTALWFAGVTAPRVEEAPARL